MLGAMRGAIKEEPQINIASAPVATPMLIYKLGLWVSYRKFGLGFD